MSEKLDAARTWMVKHRESDNPDIQEAVKIMRTMGKEIKWFEAMVGEFGEAIRKYRKAREDDAQE